jgi:hypothetical protein
MTELQNAINNKSVVFFTLTRHWFNQMLAGEKDIEYREVTPYWTARLTKRPITHAVFSCGYTRHGRIVRPVYGIDVGPCPYPEWKGEYYRISLGPIMIGAQTSDVVKAWKEVSA